MMTVATGVVVGNLSTISALWIVNDIGNAFRYQKFNKESWYNTKVVPYFSVPKK